MSHTQVFVHKLPHAHDLPLPTYMTGGAAGMDLLAAITEPLVLLPGTRALIPVGLRIALSPGVEAQVRPRSGLAIQHGITVLNSPGTIDADYRGEIKVVLANLGEDPFIVTRGDRIAQLVLGRVLRASFCESEALPDSERGEGGFGHTGL